MSPKDARTAPNHAIAANGWQAQFLAFHEILPTTRSHAPTVAEFVSLDHAVNVSRRLIASHRSETLTRYPFCVSTSQGERNRI